MIAEMQPVARAKLCACPYPAICHIMIGPLLQNRLPKRNAAWFAVSLCNANLKEENLDG